MRRRADQLLARHLDARWAFAFDRAKTRAGLCDFAKRRISVSAHLAPRWSDDELDQVLLHEIAHALAGARAAHGPAWKRVARDLGYTGSRTHDGPIADELAPWVGSCAAGHPHYRYRKPTRPVACGRCTRRFDERFLVTWTTRSPKDRADLYGAHAAHLRGETT